MATFRPQSAASGIPPCGVRPPSKADAAHFDVLRLLAVLQGSKLSPLARRGARRVLGSRAILRSRADIGRLRRRSAPFVNGIALAGGRFDVRFRWTIAIARAVRHRERCDLASVMPGKWPHHRQLISCRASSLAPGRPIWSRRERLPPESSFSGVSSMCRDPIAQGTNLETRHASPAIALGAGGVKGSRPN